jgi:hypothetical protein
VRRFLTKARRSLRRGRDGVFGLRCPIYSGPVTWRRASWTEGAYNDWQTIRIPGADPKAQSKRDDLQRPGASPADLHANLR